MSDSEFDVFISHASEDKPDVVRPLAAALKARGWNVWFDEEQLVVGDSLESSINAGLRHSRFGVVVLSPRFFEKPWTRRELEALAARETIEDRKVILPVWHDLSSRDVLDQSPTLAAKLGISTDRGIDDVADQLDRALRRAARAPARPRPLFRGVGYDVVMLRGADAWPDFDGARAAIDALDDGFQERVSDAWARFDVFYELPGRGGDLVNLESAAEILRADLQALEAAFDSPPEWLATATMDDGHHIHFIDETSIDTREQEAINRLRDAGALQAAGLTPGGW